MATIAASVAKLKQQRGASGQAAAAAFQLQIDANAFRGTIQIAQDDLERLDRQLRKTQRFAGRRFRTRSALPGPTTPGVATAVAEASLLARLKKRGFGISAEGVRFKALKIGGGGIQITGGQLAAAGGTIMVAIAATRAAGAAIGGINKFNRFLAEGKDVGEAATRVTRDTMVRTFNRLSEFIGAKRLVSEVGELFGGLSAESNAKIIDDFYTNAFKTKQERREEDEARQAFLEETFREIDTFIAEQWARLEHVRPKSFRLRNRPQLNAFQRELTKINREVIGMKDSIQKDQARRAAEKYEMAGN